MPSSVHVATANLPSIELPTRNWQRWLFAALSILLLVGIGHQLGRLDGRQLLSAIPTSPGFWLAFAGYYLALPASEWLIYRRLWGLPAEGFRALLRKLVSNEILFGYSGEASFYAWARRHTHLTSAPFGAIKDVSITSALAGNIVTLLMVALAWSLLGHLPGGLEARHWGLSVAVVLLISIAVALFRRKLFSLPAAQLRLILGVHLARLAVTTVLSGVLWHCALPDVAITAWILLAALQLLVTRLPLVPNKDLVFASATLMIVGSGSDIGRLIAIVASLILVTHLVIGAGLVAADLIDEARL